MTLLQKVRLFYSTAFFIGTSIIYCIFSSVILRSGFTIDIAVYTILFYIISAMLRKKYSSSYIYIAVPLVMVFVLEKLFSPWSISIINTVFILITNLVYLARYGNEPDYMMFKDDLRLISIAAFISVVIFVILGYNCNITSLYRCIIIYITASVLSLKESMKYSYRIETRKSADKINILILVIMIMMCSTFVSNVIFAMGRAVWGAISYAAGGAVMLLAYICGPVFEFLYKIIKSRTVSSDDINIEIADSSKYNSQQALNTENPIGDLIGIILKYIIIAVIIFLIAVVIYKLIKMITANKKMGEITEDYEENVGTVDDIPKERKWKNVVPKNNREKVIYAYNKMIRTYKKNGMFKQYMTPSQFGNVMKIKDERFNEIDKVNGIYSMARFSKHEITDSESENISKDINNILKKTGKILKNSKDF